jgi:hypothetical protein
MGLTTPHCKKILLLRNVPKLLRPKQWEKDMKFGILNIRSLQGRCNQVSSERIREVYVRFSGSARG